VRVSYVAGQSEQISVEVAYAISRKVGNAVVRNKIRRQLRSIIDDLKPPPRAGLYLIGCGIETGTLSYEQLQYHVHRAVSRANGG
jgi:ribonuclease P protein component